MIGIVTIIALAAAQASPETKLERLKAANEARGMEAATQSRARGGYGFSSVATPYGLYIMAVAPGSRAALAGLRSGDDVLAINEQSTIGMSTDQAMALIKSDPADGLEFKILDGRSVRLSPMIARAASISAAPPKQTAGCIGVSLVDCISHLKGAIRIDESELTRQLNRAAETDVNGKALGGARVLITSGYFGDSPAPHIVTFRRDAAGNVAEVEINLRGNPMIARTAQEYADTGLGVAFRAVLDDDCTAAEGDLGTFKFFENAVKPTIRFGKKDTTIDETHASTDRMSLSSALTYCGVSVRFTHLGGYDTSDITEYNEHGAYSFSTVEFSRLTTR